MNTAVIIIIIMVLRDRLPCNLHTVTNMTIARQRLAKHVPERYAVSKNRHPLLDSGFNYHCIASLSDATTVLEPLRTVFIFGSPEVIKGEEFASQ
jgi:hypothetical protein